MKKIVFLDRDGVINKYPGHFKYVTTLKGFSFLPGAREAIARLTRHGYTIFVISNQAGVGKGEYSQAELDKITRAMHQGVEKAGGKISGVFYCTHRKEENCFCRKPKTGLITAALKTLPESTFSAELADVFFIGDSIIDVETGKAAGLKTIMVFSGRETADDHASWSVEPDYTAQDLSAAVDIILGK